MTRLVPIAVLAAALAAPPAFAKAQRHKQRPRIEMVFALDTTGSMGGLIAGAKKKIWHIVNGIVSGKPTPEVRIGLVAYRDKGDVYVTQVTQLSSDLDSVYAKLSKLSAGGGGDGPEDVNQALYDAVHKIEWSDSSVRALRVIFLVGDAPPHNDYKDVPNWRQSVGDAAQHGIVVNAIRCGNWVQTGTEWAKIARLGHGTFLTINQTGGMIATRTPYDKKLARLSTDLDSTYVLGGTRRTRMAAHHALKKAEATASAGGGTAAADRAAFRARGPAAESAPAPAAKADLVTAAAEGRAGLDKTLADDEALPAKLKKMPVGKRKGYLQAQAKKRQKIRTEMAKVARQRDKWLARHESKKTDAFDAKVVHVVRAQATAAADIAY